MKSPARAEEARRRLAEEEYLAAEQEAEGSQEQRIATVRSHLPPGEGY